MVLDFEIKDLDKSIQDIVNSYNKESLIVERNEVLAKLDGIGDLTKDEIQKYEKRLNDIIIQLAKMK